MKMYFVQRGKFNDLKSNNIYGNDGLLNLDYMGSSEFEFYRGDSLKRICKSVISGEYFHKKTDLKSIGGVPINIFAKNEAEWEMALAAIKEYLDNKNPKEICKYRLKEYIDFEYNMIPWYNEHRHVVSRFNFYWDIDNDFFFYIGAKDRFNAIERCMYNFSKEYFNGEE